MNYDATLAHTPARRPKAPAPRRQRYPGNSYPGMWTGDGNLRHAAIGAIIGFGLGAALGAKANTDQHAGATVRTSVLVGSFGALIGAAVGHGNPWFSRRHPRTRWPNEDDIVGAEGTSGPPSRQ